MLSRLPKVIDFFVVSCYNNVIILQVDGIPNELLR